MTGIHQSPMDSPHKRPAKRDFDIFFDIRFNTRLKKQWSRPLFGTPWRSLWRHSNIKFKPHLPSTSDLKPKKMLLLIFHHPTFLRNEFHLFTNVPSGEALLSISILRLTEMLQQLVPRLDFPVLKWSINYKYLTLWFENVSHNVIRCEVIACIFFRMYSNNIKKVPLFHKQPTMIDIILAQ